MDGGGPSPAADVDPIRRRVELLVILALVVVAAGLQVWAVSIQSLSGDSAYHLLAGDQALRTGENLLNLEHPPLVKLLVSLPLLLEDSPLAPPLTVERALAGSTAVYDDPDRLRRVTLRARAVAVVCFVLPLAVGCRFLGARFGGRRAGWALVLLLGLSFSVVPIVGTLQTDAAVACFGVWMLVACCRFVNRPSWVLAVVVGLALGGAMASKFSGLLLAPTAVATVLAAPEPGRRWRARFAQLVVMGLVALAVVHLVYAAANWSYDSESGRAAITSYCQNDGTLLVRDRLAAAEPMLLAVEGVDPLLAQWLTGLLGVQAQNAEGAYFSYAFGSVSRWGRWWFFPVLLAVKIPMVLLLVTAAAIAAAARGGGPPGVSRQWWPPAVAAAVYLAAAITSNYNLGFRHLLPVLPILLLPLAVWLANRPRAALAVGLVLAVESLVVGPHWMSATNTWWLGAANPTRFALGAGNTEYRQNFVVLARTLDRLGIDEVGVLFPLLPPEVVDAYLPGGRLVEPGDPVTAGWYAVNATVEQLVPAVLAAPQDDLPSPGVKAIARDWLELWSAVRRGEDHGWIAGTFRLYRVDDGPAATIAR